MSGFVGPQLAKGRGGLGRRNPGDTGWMGLIAGGPAVLGTFSQETPYILNSPEDADTLGINAAYDATNGVKTRHHIDRFFHYAPEGTLVLMGFSEGDGVGYAAFSVLPMIVTAPEADRKIRIVGICGAEVTTWADDMDGDLIPAIASAQNVVNRLLAESIYLDGVLLEGLINPSERSDNIPDLSVLEAENVSVVLGKDAAVAGLYADVGAALGMAAVRTPGECIGSVDIANKPDAYKGQQSYPLTHKGKGYFVAAALSNDGPVSGLSIAQKALLESKRYIYAGSYEGFAGVYFNDSHTCSELANDYAYIEDNRVWNEAARRVRPALIRFMKSRQQVDATTGKLSATVLAQFESAAQNSCKDLVDSGDLAALPTLILDPNQNFLATGAIDLTVTYVKNGILRTLTGTIGATNPSA